MKILLSNNNRRIKNSNLKRNQTFGCANCEKLAELYVNKTPFPRQKLIDYFVSCFTQKGTTEMHDSFVIESFAPIHDEEAAKNALTDIQNGLKNGDESLFNRTLKFVQERIN